jgi:hypothetical protein
LAKLAFDLFFPKSVPTFCRSTENEEQVAASAAKHQHISADSQHNRFYFASLSDCAEYWWISSMQTGCCAVPWLSPSARPQLVHDELAEEQ